MEEQKPLTEKESLELITKMINKAKSSYNESGTGPILWGTVVGIAGLTSFAENNWNFSIGFDIWIITLLAIIPQVVIAIRDARKRKVVRYEESSLNAIWLVFGISIFALTFYNNVLPDITDRLLNADGVELLIKNNKTGEIKHFVPYIFSASSLFLLLYGIPTLATGLATKFRPMIIGGILCYCLFVISCYTPTKYDMLLNGIAGIINWLIPGLILRSCYIKDKKANV
jgi:hypothetical protein